MGLTGMLLHPPSFLPTCSMEQSRERYPGDRALPTAPTAKQALTPKSARDWRKSSSSSSKFLQHGDLPSLALRKPHAKQRAAERAHTRSLQPPPGTEHRGDRGYSTANKSLAPESLHPSACLCPTGIPATRPRQQETPANVGPRAPLCLAWDKIKAATALKKAEELT